MSKHYGVCCDGCNVHEFSTARYKCQICHDYDLCLTCYNRKIQTVNHLYSHPMIQIKPRLTNDSDILLKQHTNQMNHLEARHLSRFSSNIPVDPIRTRMISKSTEMLDKQSTNDNQLKMISSIETLNIETIYYNRVKIVSSSETIDKRSITDTIREPKPFLVQTPNKRIQQTSSSIEPLENLSYNELYEFLIRYDQSLHSIAEKLKNVRVSGIDLINFEADDSRKLLVTFEEKRKLQLLIEQQKSTSHSVQIQTELNHLRNVIETQGKQIQEKEKIIQQLEGIIQKNDQQAQKIVSLTSSSQSFFEQQSSIVQDQLINISDNIKKVPIVSSDQDIPIVQSNIPIAIDLSGNKQHVPVSKVSLPISSKGPQSSDVQFLSVFHPDQDALITKPIIDNPYDINNYGTYQLTIYSQDSQHIITETLLNVIPEIEICVPKEFIIRDSVNNIIVGGTLTLKSIAEDFVVFTGKTDENGMLISPDDLRDGSYEVQISSPINSKLQTLKFIMVIYQNRRQNQINKFIGRSNLELDQIHILLEWNEEPRDLDAHLFSSDGKHLYYKNKDDKDMTLDCDVTTGFGPETITFTLQPGVKYIYAVHRYSDEPKLTESKAKVTFNFDSDKTHISQYESEKKLINGEIHRIPELTCPNARFWIVCMIDGSTKQIKFFPATFEEQNDHETNVIGTKYLTA